MARYAKDNRPHLKPVEKIHLSGEYTLLRAVVAALFLLIGAGALAYAFMHALTPESGWQTIQTDTTDGATCGDDFTFLYELGAGDRSVAAESRGLTRLYTQACRTAYRLFHTDESFEGVVNLKEINGRPNQVLEVDEVLYQAFETIREAGDRTVYLGPVYTRYDDLFDCQDDSQLVDFDPRLSRAVAEEYAAVAAYAGDPGHIDVELLGENRIRLRVSEEYLAYAEREGIERFLDFGWLKNALIADYLADTLVEAGYTHGCISSFDGFARCLDDRETGYGLNLLEQREGVPVQVGTMEYRGPMSLASLYTFPAGEGDKRRFYRLRSGETRTLYLDPADGLCRGAADSMVFYSRALSCGQLAVEAAPVFIADVLDVSAAQALTSEGMQWILCRDGRIAATDAELTVTNLREGYMVVDIHRWSS